MTEIKETQEGQFEKPILDTRARFIRCESKILPDCDANCGEAIRSRTPDQLKKFGAAINAYVCCNVYEGEDDARSWDRVEIYHPECYEEAGMPYGEPLPAVASQRIKIAQEKNKK